MPQPLPTSRANPAVSALIIQFSKSFLNVICDFRLNKITLSVRCIIQSSRRPCCRFRRSCRAALTDYIVSYTCVYVNTFFKYFFLLRFSAATAAEVRLSSTFISYHTRTSMSNKKIILTIRTNYLTIRQKNNRIINEEKKSCRSDSMDVSACCVQKSAQEGHNRTAEDFNALAR